MKNKRQVLNARNIFLGSVTTIFCLVILIFISRNDQQSVSHHNLIDTKISQYSDSHITPNAIATDSKFKDIAFETPPPSNWSFFSSQLALVIKAIKSITNPPSGGSKEYGSWIWTPVMTMTPEYMDSILSQTKADKVNAIYLSIDTYLDIFTMDKGAEREKQRKDYSDKLSDFISLANAKGIAVDAEAGWRNWAEGDNIYKGLAVISFVKNFNATHASKFRGFQYDIEPYLLDSYSKDNKAQVSILGDYVGLIDKTQYFIGASALRFSVVVPDFYDKKDKMTPEFSYNGQKGYVLTHLLNILDKRPDSSIIVMSYRNFADGSDGAIEVSSNELRTANSGHNTKIIIAQETGDVAPPYITFHNTSKKYLLSQIQKINTAFNSYSNFGGIAIHYANAFLALK